MTDNKEALGTSQDAQATSEPFPAPPTPEQIAEWEAEREARSEAELAPYKAFAARQKANTETIAEHDDLMAYKLMKRIIARDVKNGTLNRAATMDKLDAFLAADRLTATEYQELVAMMPDE